MLLQFCWGKACTVCCRAVKENMQAMLYRSWCLPTGSTSSLGVTSVLDTPSPQQGGGAQSLASELLAELPAGSLSCWNAEPYKSGIGNCKPPRRVHTQPVRRNRCILQRWVSLLLELLTSLMFALFSIYYFLQILLSKLPVPISRWLPFWLICPSRRCFESSFKWKHPCVWLNTWHSLGYFTFHCDTSKPVQVIFLLEIAPCNCTWPTGLYHKPAILHWTTSF